MSIANDSLDALFSDDLTVAVLANGTYGKGLFEQPTTVALGDQVIFTAVSYTHLTLPTTPYV